MKKLWHWLNSNWTYFTPLIVFITFMGLYMIGQAALIQCKTKPDFLCSTVKGQNYLPLDIQERFIDGKIVDNHGEVVKDKNGNVTNVTYSKIMADRYGRQFVWVFFATINVFLCFAALVVFFLIAQKYVERKYILACLFISLFFGCISAMLPGPVIERTVNSTIALGDGGIQNFSINAFGKIEISVAHVIRFVNFLTESLAIVTAFTLCAVLFRNSAQTKKSNSSQTISSYELRKQALLEQVDDLRLILYVATVLLVVGILRMSAVLNWALAFLQPNAAEAAGSFFGMFTFVIGSSYTMLLAAIYIPAYYILKFNANKLASEPEAAEDNLRDKFKSEFFNFSLRDSLPRIIAIAAPFLTGTIVEQLITGLLPD